MTSDADRRVMIQLARDAIDAHVRGVDEPPIPAEGPLGEPGAAFVTLHSQGTLRGCIGHIRADEPLGMVIARCAVAACSTDPRFPPVTESELPRLALEISLLGPLESIAGPGDVEIGRHGLMVEQGWRRGLLLPQVALEWHWDAGAFLARTCEKAGLPPDAWRRGAQLWRFEAEIFSE